MEEQHGTIAEDQSANGTLAASSVAPSKPASNKPNKWLAMVLAFVHPSLGMLFVVKPTAAALYLIVGGMLARYASADKYAPMVLMLVITLGIRVVAMAHAHIAAVQYPEDKPRPWYSRGPLAVALNVAVVLLVPALNMALYRMAQHA